MYVLFFLFPQIVSGVGYAHNQHICHRDMKLDNVLLSRPGYLKEIKLADFGLSDFYRPGATMRTNCGSISYLAPEVSGRAEAMVQWTASRKASCTLEA